MLKIVRTIQSLLSIRHGFFLFLFLLFLALLMQKSSLTIKESVVSKALSSVFFPGQLFLSSISDFHKKTAENERLKKENAELLMELYHVKEGIRELPRLHQLVHFDNQWPYSIVTARVVGRNPGRFLTTLVINRGSLDGLAKDMPVFFMKGLVGKTSQVQAKHSTVQLLLDPNIKISIMIKRSRMVGFMESVHGHLLSATIPSNAGAKIGDTVITSGLGGIFPKGIEIGVIENIRKSDLEVMRYMDIKPFQEFSLLEEVFVMQKEPDWVVQELLN
ncbi:MAG: rod shape-determining protein MreC [Fibrobacter sp.]|jgi:rod shape-determining protein MreC|nr:rod shape-determining protein MreC [Fibrobacter sp.]